MIPHQCPSSTCRSFVATRSTGSFSEPATLVQADVTDTHRSLGERPTPLFKLLMRQPTWPRRKCLSRCCTCRIFLRKLQPGKHANRSSSDANVVTCVISEPPSFISTVLDASSWILFVCSCKCELLASITYEGNPKLHTARQTSQSPTATHGNPLSIF